MSKTGKLLASTYQYDPLDRLASANTTQRFYNQSRIATEIEGERKSRFFEFDSQPLAVQQHGTAPGTTLLATDQQTSVLNGVSPQGDQQAQAFSPFGYHAINALLNVVGFNGERPEPLTGHYLLGQGYRAFNPVLMRFNSPDSWSPFGEGGINAYAYCDNDPANKIDPTGHFPNIWKGLKNIFTSRIPSSKRPVTKVGTDAPKIDIPATETTLTTLTTKLLHAASDAAPPPYSPGKFEIPANPITKSLLSPPYRKFAPAYDNTGITIAPITDQSPPPNYWISENSVLKTSRETTPDQILQFRPDDVFSPQRRLPPAVVSRNRQLLREYARRVRR